MREEHIKLILYSVRDSDFRELSLSGKTLLTWGGALVVAIIFVSIVLAWVISTLLKDYKMAHLERTNRKMQTEIQKLQERVKSLHSRLGELEKADNDLRLLVNLPPIDTDVRNVGVGGNESSVFDDLDPTQGPGVDNLSAYLDELERRIQLAFESRAEIEEKFRENQELLRHIPSIRPVVGGRIAAGYGYRLDPLIGKIRHHDGVDLAAPQGTQVFAAADGVVESVAARSSLSPGYGREVIINHGFGFKTRYAHLSRVLVQPGQKVSRWDVIGLVGQTGRATGPHLHYEVLVNGLPVNPLDYILD
ncbi:MAG: M23 family metallopeptidase [candidate division KSB1 bacterium]|nr:M23 family metallopeptidase [candidate division KSB1 bacterium]